LVWMPSSIPEDLFEDLKLFLVESKTLDSTDADIYVLGLKKGAITSGDVLEARITPRQSTAGDHLRRLSNAGFFDSVLAEDNRKGKGRARAYKAAPPEAVLKDALDMHQRLNSILGKIMEHSELLSEAVQVDGEIWLIRPQKTAMKRASAMLQNAKKSIKIYGHDCTWFNDFSVNSGLAKAASGKVKVHAIATNPDVQTMKGLRGLGVTVAQTKTPCVPFCLIDDIHLLLPCKGGALENEYFIISTRQRYLVDCFVKVFEGMEKPE